MREAGLKAHFYARIVMRERGHAPDDATPVGLLRWLARSHVPWLARLAQPVPDARRPHGRRASPPRQETP